MQITSTSAGSSITADKAMWLKDAGTEKDFSRILDAAAKKADDKKLYKSCQQLESVFLQQVLGAMRNTISRSQLLESGFAEETFESMLYEEYAGLMSKSGSTGISDILYRQLSMKAQGI